MMNDTNKQKFETKVEKAIAYYKQDVQDLHEKWHDDFVAHSAKQMECVAMDLDLTEQETKEFYSKMSLWIVDFIKSIPYIISR